MPNLIPGNLGHFFVILAFVSCTIAAIGYYYSAKNTGQEKEEWLKFSRVFYGIHGFSVLMIVGTLFFIIYNHLFEYHYAWSHSSRQLPVHYMVSSFWEGQEGSFLLWIFWHVLLGAVLIKVNKYWEAPMMTIFCLVQAFLLSMILGISILDLKIGSSPFILLRDALSAPIFLSDPNFIPEDGSGLNPLLQNYWMVIHPPTLFLGFAAMLVPFAYCLAGLWQGKYKEWIRPALPWSLFTVMVLGVGILMGAYWAYETLNFGGYWNWDPVENAIYVPWLVLVGGIHTMITFKKSNTALKASVLLIITSFLLILYATFLTRSGILGESSVHSFTDLGLSGQLLLYFVTFSLVSLFWVFKRWKSLPSSQEEVSTYSREFWIFIGATTLCLMGFQVLIPTSIPVWNAIVEGFGGISNMAPPADQVAFYTKFQLWFAVAIAFLSGTGQFFWWKKIDKQSLFNALYAPVLITLVLSALFIVLGGISQFSYMVLLTAGIYSIISNGKILISVLRKSPKLSGGAIAHMGIAMMLIGVLTSSGYSSIISKNTTGMIWHRDFPEEVNRDNILLFLNEPRQLPQYTMTYQGKFLKLKGVPGYHKENQFRPTMDPSLLVAEKEITTKKGLLQKGDTVEIQNFENRYFKVLYQQASGREFTLYPRVQMNEAMGMVYSPDIRRALDRDLYSHVRTFPDPEEDTQWGETEKHQIKIGERFFVNDFVAVFDGVETLSQLDGVRLNEGDFAVQANIRIFGDDQEYQVQPIYLIKNKMVGKIPEVVDDLALKISLDEIIPAENSFVFSTNASQKDWIILEAVEKPFINILWLGTLVLVMGFGVAIYRRYDEFIKMRDKGIE